MVESILDKLSGSDLRVLNLLDTFKVERNEKYWQQDARLYHAFGRKLIGAGHPTRAFDLVREGLLHHPGDLELKYLSALALSRGRNITKAAEYVNELLDVLEANLKLREDALSLAGRLSKDKYERSSDASLKRELAAESAQLYEKAHLFSGGWFPGINAATMSLLAGQPERARKLATIVVQQALSERQVPGKEKDYWLLASLGEAHCILGNLTESAAWYRQAVSLARPFTGDIASMRRNQQLLSEMTPVPQEILDLFNLGSVVVFTSHMIDHPHRAEKGLAARFPADPALEEAVVQAVREELQNLNVVVGYCSAACGSDILFAEQMRQRGAELHVVLPFTDEDFYITSVDFGLEEMTRWRQRCEDILNDKETEVHYATKEHYLGDDVLFEFTNLFTQGLAMNHASRIWSEPFALAVVDSASTSALGGTTSFLESWKQTNGQFRVIDLAELRSKIDWKAPLARSTEKSHQTAITAGSVKREIKAMLFADVKNFSQLSEEQAPTFFLKYLNVLAEVVQASRCKPVFCNTWGDGLYLVFNRVDDCADLALRLLDKVENMNWKELGLPPDTTVRMGLHAGPVYPGVDPLIEKKNFFGSHVNRAARIEPVTTPGCAFASEQFAALLTVEAGDRFICEFIGVEPLAKGYDRCPLYRLGRK